MEMCDQFDVRMLAYDRYLANTVIPQVVEAGIEVEAFGQGYKSMSYPTKQMESLMIAGKILHGGDAVLRWQFGCVKIAMDDAENIKVSKGRNLQGQMVDGVVASVMALGSYFNNRDETDFSFDIVSL